MNFFFLCRKCIPDGWKCDGDSDCPDDSDEYGCPTNAASTCESGEFQCKDGSCIHRLWRCDSEPDCSDDSDELDCPSSCGYYKFQCATGECIEKNKKCDGVVDCGDQSDEIDCCECLNMDSFIDIVAASCVVFCVRFQFFPSSEIQGQLVGRKGFSWAKVYNSNERALSRTSLLFK